MRPGGWPDYDGGLNFASPEEEFTNSETISWIEDCGVENLASQGTDEELLPFLEEALSAQLNLTALKDFTKRLKDGKDALDRA